MYQMDISDDERVQLESREVRSTIAEDEVFFTRERILFMISLYKKYKPQVRVGKIKSMKHLWEHIARDVSTLYRITISAAKCENKWKVLERNYKRVVDNNNSTGTGRKTFEYEKEFDDIFRKQRNITPAILLTSDSVLLPCSSKSKNIESGLVTIDIQSNENEVDTHREFERSPENKQREIIHVVENSQLKQKPKKRLQRKAPVATYKRRNDILTEIKDDLKSYYKKKLDYDQKRLELKERNMNDREKKTQLLEEYIALITQQQIFED